MSAEARSAVNPQPADGSAPASGEPGLPPGFADEFSSLARDDRVQFREGDAQVGDVRLHYLEAGTGPLVLLLHGFPEFWYGWRRQMAPLAAAGFRVVAPDLRGYNLSSRPPGVDAYTVDKLAVDVRELIRELGAPSASLAGHDWGGSVAWTVAMNHPEVVDRLAILNAAHPRRLLRGLRRPSQLRKSWYFFFFTLPALPERVVRARHWHFFRHFLKDARPAFTAQEFDRYVDAWSQPGSAAAMLNYYAASVRQKNAEAQIRQVSAPTLVIWGQRDRYLGADLAEPARDDVPNLDRVERLPGASHWVHHDEAARVTELLIGFFTPVAGARSAATGADGAAR
jgi:epoxide hydrolase 4